MFTDEEGQITEINDAFLAMWGYETREQILGKTALELHPKAESERVLESMDYIKAGGPGRMN